MEMEMEMEVDDDQLQDTEMTTQLVARVGEKRAFTPTPLGQEMAISKRFRSSCWEDPAYGASMLFASSAAAFNYTDNVSKEIAAYFTACEALRWAN
uniref:Uncharacterized protein n=1 Tax=Leersia perrieri TaxID=77586 RepID=A0A0D9XVA0_9ORYZ